MGEDRELYFFDDDQVAFIQRTFTPEKLKEIFASCLPESIELTDPPGRLLLAKAPPPLEEVIAEHLPAAWKKEWEDEELPFTAGEADEFLRIDGCQWQWIIRVSVSGSMTSGVWGLGEFSLGDTGYVLGVPDLAERQPLLLLGGWQPRDDGALRRRCITEVYWRFWEECYLPPAPDQSIEVGDDDLVYECLLTLLSHRNDAWVRMLEELQRCQETEELTEEVAEFVSDLTGLPVSTIRRCWETVYEKGGWIDPTDTETKKVLVGLYVYCHSVSFSFQDTTRYWADRFSERGKESDAQ